MCLCTSCTDGEPDPKPAASPRMCEWCGKEVATIKRPLRGLTQDLHLCASCERVVARQLVEGSRKAPLGPAMREAGVL